MICAVMVVPMFAPMTMGIACRRPMSLALTNPMTMTVVALELCSTAVANAPARTPMTGFFVTAARMEGIRSPAASCKLPLIVLMPYRKIARPPARPKTTFIISLTSTYVPLP